MKLHLNNAFDNRIDLPPSILEKGITKRFKKGDILFNKGDQSKNLTYINRGIVGLVNLAPNGHESLLRVFGEKFFLGYRSFLVGEHYHASAIALSDGELLIFPYTGAEEVQAHLPELFLHLTRMIARDLRIAEERFNDITGKRVVSRIIETLIFLKQRHPGYQWTRREIGEFCGAKTETVTRALTKLEKAGLIEKEGREIHLSDIQELLEYSEGQEALNQ
ncbi:MAG: Crp/Fnr family transcriptional regulator [Bacteriovoracaceae bacterium]|nr:Crp/Fnr family transcriptional regulator [Bacteriovoracaceae bacterium]